MERYNKKWEWFSYCCNGISPKIIGNMLKNIKRFLFTGLEDNATAVKLLGIIPIYTVAFLGKAIACKMGMVGVYPDIYNIFNILREVPTNATIQNNKNETYYFK